MSFEHAAPGLLTAVQACVEGIELHRALLWIHPHRISNLPRRLSNQLLVMVRQAAAEVEVDGTVHLLEAGDTIWIPKGAVRRITPCPESGPEEDIRIHFSLPLEIGGLFGEEPLVVRCRWDLSAYFRLLSEIFSRAPGRSGVEYLRVLQGMPQDPPSDHLRFQLNSVLAALLTAFLFPGEESEETHDRFSRLEMERLRISILSRLHVALTIEGLAGEAGLSADYFARKFRRSFGIPPMHYLREQRMERASVYLAETALPVQEIGRLVGYGDANLFTRTFHRSFGISPSRFRVGQGDQIDVT